MACEEKISSSYIERLLSVVFPAFCLECGAKIPSSYLLCSFCREHLTVVEEQVLSHAPYQHIMPIFEPTAPVLALLEARGISPDRLARTMAAMMAVSSVFKEKSWDAVIEAPGEPFLLARYLAQFLHIPYTKKPSRSAFWDPSERLLVVSRFLPSVELPLFSSAIDFTCFCNILNK